MTSYKENLEKSRRSAPNFDERTVMYDIVFVMNVNSKGWILEKICKVIEKYSKLNCGFVYSERNDRITSPLPKAKHYFFAHYALLYTALVKNPDVFGGDRYVWYTHPDPAKGISFDDLVLMLNSCTHVFTPNTHHKRMLELAGIAPDNISVPLGGADPDLFQRHDRGSGKVGFVGAYYPRKCPDKMLDLVRAMPGVDFLLVAPARQEIVNSGLLWSNWPQFPELLKLPNFAYVEAAYDEFPRWYDQMDVYVSLSTVEGGPIPVIEAMMVNAIPVSTRTGFAEDVIQHGKTGYIVELDEPIPEIAKKVRAALADVTTDVRATAIGFTWENFAKDIWRQIGRPAVLGQKVGLSSEADPHRFLRGGWHRPENTGCWTAETYARISLPLAKAAAGSYVLTVYLWTFDRRLEEELLVDIWLNGKSISQRYLADSKPVLMSGSFGLDEAAAARPLDIVIVSSLVTKPAGSAEERKLGVKVGFVEVTAADDRAVLGRPVSFAAPSVKQTMLVRGWHRPETMGVWSANREAAVALAIDPSIATQPLDLVVDGRTFGARQPNGAGVNYEIALADRVVRTEEIRESDNFVATRISLPAPPSWWDGTLELRIARSTIFTPTMLNPASADTRPLGFFLRSITVMPPDQPVELAAPPSVASSPPAAEPVSDAALSVVDPPDGDAGDPAALEAAAPIGEQAVVGPVDEETSGAFDFEESDPDTALWSADSADGEDAADGAASLNDDENALAWEALGLRDGTEEVVLAEEDSAEEHSSEQNDAAEDTLEESSDTATIEAPPGDTDPEADGEEELEAPLPA